MTINIIGALVISGFFTGSVTTLAWNRLKAWKHMSNEQFKEDFAETIRVADKLQPILLVIAFSLTLWFATSTSGTARVLAILAAIFQAGIMVSSLLLLVPLQRRLIALHEQGTADSTTLKNMRHKWCNGHQGRSVLSVVMLLTITIAAIIS